VHLEKMRRWWTPLEPSRRSGAEDLAELLSLFTGREILDTVTPEREEMFRLPFAAFSHRMFRLRVVAMASECGANELDFPGPRT